MSQHKVEVVPVRLQKHPNADALSVVEVFGFTACVRTADFQGVSLGAYIPPDSLVPADRPEFAFLAPKAKGGRARIKVARLRGVVSQGLLVPAKPGWAEGQDVADLLGVTHYDPPEPFSTGGEDEPPPEGNRPVYDVENWRRFRHLFRAGEPVLVTEKIHGANARYAFVDGRMRCGSHKNWKKEDPTGLNVWWKALKVAPAVEAFCRAHPEITVYAEVYGAVQDLKYGTKPGEVRVAAYDLLRGNAWVPAAEARALGEGLPWVPTLFEGPYDESSVDAFAEGPSTMPLANHLREGCVVKPLEERTDPEIGRVQLKIVGNAYLERA
ncbi:MAG: RNA ligase (ATP) [Planctomycetota bacterium]